jgi:hypothetical protein
MENSNIKPIGLKGQEKINRMIDLMKITPIKENVNRSVVELTKIGPDGKSYAIVKENQEYYIKVSDKTDNLMTEDFNYIGGLMNKKDKAYPSYAKATKHLNLKFMSLAESLGQEKTFNILRNDNLIKEGSDINGGDAVVDKKTSGDNLATGDNIGEDDFEKAKTDGTKDGNTGTHSEKHVMEEVELTEDETYIDEMLDPVGKEDDDVNNDGEKDEQDDYIKNKRISISKAMNEMDSIIDGIAGEHGKINEFLSSLTETERKMLENTLKKKA